MTKILPDNKTEEIAGDGLVLIGGCFDIIHPGHIEFLKKARKEGKALILLLENDENIKRLKGKNRPMNNQIVRAENLSNTGLVDYIILLNNPKSSQYYYNLVKSIQPDIIAVTTPDPLIEAKKEQAEMVGGKVVAVMERNKNYSTSKLLQK